MDKMDEIVYDPVDQKAMKKSEAYAQHDDLYFGSLETQQMYYNLLEKGFEVVFAGGKPVLQPRKPVQVWNKDVYVKQSTVTENQSGLQEGDYTLKLEYPDKNSRKTKVMVQVTSGDGVTVLKTAQVGLSKEYPIHTEKFVIPEEHTNATLNVTADVEGGFLSMVKRSVHILGSLDFLPMSKTKKEINQARRASKSVARSGERVVELTKGTTGVGMTLGWDKQLRSVVIKSIEENGAAARTKQLKVGDRIIGVQGERVDAMSFKQVIKRLRNVPMTVVLLVADRPDGYRPVTRNANAKQRRIDDPKRRPPRPVRGAPPRKAPPPPGQARANGAPPPGSPARRPSGGVGKPVRPPPPRPKAPAQRQPPPVPGATTAAAAAAAAVSAPPPPPTRSNSSGPPPPPTQPAASAPPPPPPVRETAPPVPAAPTRQAAPPPPPTQRRTAPPPPPTQQRQPPPAAPSRAPAPPPPTPSPPTRAAAPAPPIQQRQSPPPPPPSAAPTVASPAGYEKYTKMKKAGLPEGAILNAMRRDGVEPPAGFFEDQSIAQESTKAVAPPVIPQHGGGAPPPPPSAAGNLMAQIQQGAHLKKTEAPAEPRPPSGGGAGGLLAEIQAGAKLKKVEHIEKPPPVAASGGMGGLLAQIQAKPKLNHVDVDKVKDERRSSVPVGGALGAIAQALDARREQIASDSDSEDEEWNDDDEWVM